MSSNDFYRAFEDRHRGPRELIRDRLKVYQPFITPLLSIYQPAQAVDLGCGRGEWLELLQDAGFTPQGVDMDPGMLQACTERGLPVIQGDALAYLQSLDDASQCLVSGFHIAEHLPFGTLETFVVQAFRVLKPGGLLILETPNPENLVVGTNSFYLDPTHVRPIPPLLLSFLSEHHGFARIHTLRLQEAPVLHERSDVSLLDVLSGVSPDYAVVAQKGATPETLAIFDPAFETQYGISLHELANRFDDRLNKRITELDQRLANSQNQAGGMTEALERISTLQDRLLSTGTELAHKQGECELLQNKVSEYSARVQDAEARMHSMQSILAETQKNLDAARQELHEVHQANHHHWQLAETRQKNLDAVYRSWSWRVTAPMRWGGAMVLRPVATARTFANWVICNSIETFQRPLSKLMAYVLRRPQLSYRINQVLLRYPALYQQLLGVAHRTGVVAAVPARHSAHTLSTTGLATSELVNLTPRARQIYADLKKAIENNKGAD